MYLFLSLSPSAFLTLRHILASHCCSLQTSLSLALNYAFRESSAFSFSSEKRPFKLFLNAFSFRLHKWVSSVWIVSISFGWKEQRTHHNKMRDRGNGQTIKTFWERKRDWIKLGENNQQTITNKWDSSEWKVIAPNEGVNFWYNF
jgi:hypothetical protein